MNHTIVSIVSFLFMTAIAGCATASVASEGASGESVSLQPDSIISESLQPNAESEPEPEVYVVRHKGSSAGMNIIPSWIQAYLAGGAAAVQMLPDFTDTLCMVSEFADADLTTAITEAINQKIPQGYREVTSWWMQVHTPQSEQYLVYVLYTIPHSEGL